MSEFPSTNIPPEMYRANPTLDSDWAKVVLEFVREAASKGFTAKLTLSEPATYTPAEFARIVGTSRPTIQRRIESGDILAKKSGARWRIPESEIDRFHTRLKYQLAALTADEDL
ncbi:MAG: helix-turn-helix domain-containing protein [Ancrocorticia sp.]|uniref:helix-turn-helix domain-containing protein n=1 Tax=Ancrocorticia sp. TaxID=2593684 RepID=UPI003F8FD077